MRQLTLLLPGAGLVACSTQERDNMDTGSAAGLGDPVEGITHPTPPLTPPAQNTPTGKAVRGVRDKAIWLRRSTARWR